MALRLKGRRHDRLDVDHIVAYDLWQTKLEAFKAGLKTSDAALEMATQELPSMVNELGNCMLLEKNFNISKSNKALKLFLEGVHEFKQGTLTLDEWAMALDLKMPQIDSANTTIEVLRTCFTERTQKIRGDLEQFVRGIKARIDLESN